ncbi:MAG: fumarylacetoacetate hydrolase family protein [Alphaproteobacteria bacterium]|nr:fumarylacetoacetate hydrolase family protein [Alphaproteobacteria bacterium]
MTPTEIHAAAVALLRARFTHTQFTPTGPAPATDDEAYAIQDAVANGYRPVDGWKTGARSPEATPNCAPLLKGHVIDGPASFPAASMAMLGIEAEVAFRFARDITSAPSDEAVLDAIGSAHVVMEVVDTRLADYKSLAPLWALSDNQMNKALVIGPSFANWRTHDYAKQPVKLIVDGKPLVDKIGGLSGGSPLRLVQWLAKHVVARRGGIHAGQVVTTGSWVGLQFVQPGAKVEAIFPGLGATSVTFPA